MEIIYSFAAGLSCFFGSLLIVYFSNWTKKRSLYFVNFAAGVMIAISFLCLLPESIAMGEKSAYYLLAGFSAMFFLQFILLFHPCRDETHEEDCFRYLGFFSTFGLSLHSFIDGLIIAIGFEADFQLGLWTSLAILLHKLPDGTAISAILIHNGYSKKKIALLSGIMSAFTPIGTICGLSLLGGISQTTLSALLAAAAGSFIFLASADLIPETHKSKNRIVPFMFFAGLAVIFLIENILKI
ncbi:MAG: ZIP family metal transporter [Elusimicrobiota bacterium]|jgi:zinc transporter ZupT|nr:ZIP family metal transporter [Elusimicrobiota bacterium]